MSKPKRYWEQSITKSGVSILDVLLPHGIPRNSFVMLGGEAGTGKSAIVTELAYRTLKEKEEPVIYVIDENSPLSLYHRFLGMGWDIEPFIETKSIRIIDAFTALVEETAFDKDQSQYIQLSDINAKIHKRLDTITTQIRDPSNIELLLDYVYRWLNKLNMINQGIIIFDSLTELYSRVGARLFNNLKNIRAIACSIRFVPVWGVAHFGISNEFPSGFDYLSDGLIDLRFEKSLMESGILVKQLRVRRMSGVKSYPIWVSFRIESQKGCVTTARLIEDLKAEIGELDSKLAQLSVGTKMQTQGTESVPQDHT
ncbi:MAG: RAD55 family ATPase [Candidatus Heimdallarchaeota archaeon]